MLSVYVLLNTKFVKIRANSIIPSSIKRLKTYPGRKLYGLAAITKIFNVKSIVKCPLTKCVVREANIKGWELQQQISLSTDCYQVKKTTTVKT